MKRHLLLLLALLTVATAFGQTTRPAKMNFQGKIFNNGSPISGVGAFQFFINTPPINWVQTSNLTIENGLYSVVLGSGNTPLPSNLFAANDSLSMSVTYNGTLIDNIWLYPAIARSISWNEIQNIPPTLDLSATNEIQTLSISGNQLSLTPSGGSVTLPAATSGNMNTVTGTFTVIDTARTPMLAIPSAGMSSFTSLTNQGVWQSFKAIASGRLRQIVLPLAVTAGSSVVVKVYNGQGNGGQAIAQKTISGITNLMTNTTLDLTLGVTSISLNEGDIYTFEILPATGGASVVVNSANTNPYPNGVASIGYPAVINNDIAFVINIDHSFPPTLYCNNGNVGIGTNTPSAALQVNGRIKDKTGFVMPVGTMTAYAGSTAPEGWLFCDGSTLSRTTYADLFEAIGTSWGNGDGSTTFHLPDARGRFPRGVDGTAGNDPDSGTRTASNQGGNTGNLVGSLQDDELKSHTHTATPNFHEIPYAAGGAGIIANNGWQVWMGILTIAIGNTGGSETRPKNIYVHYIIKY